MTRLALLPSHIRMPAEWEPHSSTWMSWPFDEEMWFDQIDAVRHEYAQLVKAILEFEPVNLVVRDEESAESVRRLLGTRQDLTIRRTPLDDVWMRDNGAIFVESRSHQSSAPTLLATNWIFNGWGEKYPSAQDNLIPPAMAVWSGCAFVDVPWVMEGGSLDTNGAGIFLTTEQCLLSPKRNKGATRQDLEQALKTYLGAHEVLWLGDGLEGDHTDGHVDTITRFVNPHTIVTSMPQNKTDHNFAPMAENLSRLKKWAQDKIIPSIDIVELPLPQRRYTLDDGTRLPPSYANFYFCNGGLIVPQYGDPEDDTALDILRHLCPDHRVMGLSSRAIIVGGGSFHCLTQQQPDIGQKLEVST